MKKRTKTIAGVPRQYVYSGTSCFLVYGKSTIQARYGVFGIVDGTVKQVKRLNAAMAFNRMDYANARKFADLCEHMYPEYHFKVREHVRMFRKWEIDEPKAQYKITFSKNGQTFSATTKPVTENAIKKLCSDMTRDGYKFTFRKIDD